MDEAASFALEATMEAHIQFLPGTVHLLEGDLDALRKKMGCRTYGFREPFPPFEKLPASEPRPPQKLEGFDLSTKDEFLSPKDLRGIQEDLKRDGGIPFFPYLFQFFSVEEGCPLAVRPTQMHEGPEDDASFAKLAVDRVKLCDTWDDFAKGTLVYRIEWDLATCTYYMQVDCPGKPIYYGTFDPIVMGVFELMKLQPCPDY
jgi:hypothetical protein